MFKTQVLYQNDEKWESVKLGDSLETVGQWGGLLTSVTMMLNGIGYHEETPKTVNEKLKQEGGFLKSLLIPSYLPYRWPNCSYLGMQRCERSSAPTAQIDAAVQAGKPVILQVDSTAQTGIQTHFVLVKAKKGNDYVLYDPYRHDGDNPRKEVLLTTRYNHNSAELESEISAVLWFDFHNAVFPKSPQVAAVALPPDLYSVYVAEDNVALRAAPSVDGYPWRLMVRGTELTCLEPMDTAQVKPGKKGQWIRVQDPKGEQGYVAAWFVTATNFLALVSLQRDALPERKKWCLKNIVLENPEFQTWDLGGKTIPSHKPAKSFSRLLKNTVVNVLKSNQIIPKDVEAVSRSAIAYQATYHDSSVKQWVTTRVTGWVKDADLDDYNEDEREEFRKFVVTIPNQTENSTDAQQYLYIQDERGDFKARYNMCGELCVASILEKDIDMVLNTWRDHSKESRALYDSMVGKADHGLMSRHMENLFAVHNIPFERYKYDEQGNALASYIPLAHASKDQRRASDEFQAKLRDYFFITNLKIDTNTGDLKAAHSGSERNHWVVVEKITRNGGRVELYNPFPNKRQEYTFGEFYKAIGGDPNTGWWIKKETNPTFARQKATPNVTRNGNRAQAGEKAFQAPVFQVAIENPTPELTDAAQYMKIEGSRKTNLCGEFCVGFVLTQSIDNTFQRWMESQESLEREGKQPEMSQLLTWLKAYGFINRQPKAGQGEKPRTFSIDAVLGYWKAVQPDLYNSILGGSNNEKTGPEELKTMLRAYGYSDRDDFYDGGMLSSPSKTAEKLKTHFFISGVMIDGSKGGRLGGNIPHWIVVDKMTPIGNLVGGNGGWVELYNPFLNRWEEYSYREFMDAYNGGGLWVARDVNPTFTRQSRAAPKRNERESQKNNGKKDGSKKPGKPAPTQNELVQRSLQRLRAGESSNQIARALAKRLDLSMKDAERLLGISREDESPSADVEELIREQLQVDSIPPEIGRWIRETSKGDALLVEQLTDALLAFGILNVDVENKKCSRLDFNDPALSQKIEQILQKDMDASVLKIVQAVGPAFASRVIEELKGVLVKMAAEVGS